MTTQTPLEKQVEEIGRILDNLLDNIRGFTTLGGEVVMLTESVDHNKEKATQELLALMIRERELGRKAGIAENQLETINRMRKINGEKPITLAQLSASSRTEVGSSSAVPEKKSYTAGSMNQPHYDPIKDIEDTHKKGSGSGGVK